MSQYYTPSQTFVDGQTLTALDMNNVESAVNTGFTNLETDLAVQNAPQWQAQFQKNLLLNSTMRVRNVATPLMNLADNQPLFEMFFFSRNATAGFTERFDDIGGVTLLPNNIKNSIQITTSSAATPAANDYSGIEHRITGNDFRKIYLLRSTCCFHVKSSIAGTFSLVATNKVDRWYVATYTINAPNVWEEKYVELPIDTLSEGTWQFGLQTGLYLIWSCNAGSAVATATPNTWQTGQAWGAQGQVNLAATASATFHLAGPWLLPMKISPISGLTLPSDRSSATEDYENTDFFCEHSYTRGVTPGSIVTPQQAILLRVYDAPAGERRWNIRFRNRMRDWSALTVTIYNPQTGATNSIYNVDDGTSHAVTVSDIQDLGFHINTVSGAGNIGTNAYCHYVADNRLA